MRENAQPWEVWGISVRGGWKELTVGIRFDLVIWGRFKEMELCSGLDTVRKSIYFYHWVLNNFYLEGGRNEARLKLELVKKRLSLTLAKTEGMFGHFCLSVTSLLVSEFRCGCEVVLFLS